MALKRPLGRADMLTWRSVCVLCLSKARQAGQVSRHAAFLSASRSLSMRSMYSAQWSGSSSSSSSSSSIGRQTTKRSVQPPIRPQRRHLLTRGGTAPTTIDAHQQQVDAISARVRGFYERKEKFRIFHGSTNSTRKSAMGRDPKTVVDTSRLNHVISVDVDRRTALVEPNVPMDRLVEETLKYGLVPPVVMEFPGITVGGGYSGTAGESSSFKHGFFDRTLNKVEMVLATGEVITASEHENADLFRGAAGAVGTFGVTTMVELQLIRATKYVEATYHPVASMEEATAKLLDFTSRPDDFDYIDGIMYSPTTGAIITGRVTDTPSPGIPEQRFSDPKDPWFYLHVRDRITSSPSTPTSDAIPLPDYLFRYDRGGFWVGEGAFDYFKFPFAAWSRRWLDDFLHTRMLYNALHSSGRSEHMIIQDLALPYPHAAEFVTRMDRTLNIWPLWLCPLKQSPAPTMHPHYYPASASDSNKDEEHKSDSMPPMLNIGLWGKSPPGGHEAFVAANRAVEAALQDLGGMKWLYAQTYFSEDAFWRDFDRDWYEALRKKYKATGLPSAWEKVHVNVEAEERAARKGKTWREKVWEMWPVPGIVGLRRSIQSGDYVQAREAAWREWVPRKD